MALSNWDTLAVNLAGPCTGSLTRDEVSVDFYKNWLYLRDTKAWHEAAGYVEPTIGQINEGDLSYKRVKILARRGPQNGVFAVVQSGWSNDPNYQVMVGCGVYGYDEEEEFVGVSEESRVFLGKMVVEEFGPDPNPVIIQKLLEALSLGVRFNQGDAFFANKLGTEIPATTVGAAQPTILSNIIDTMKEQK